MDVFVSYSRRDGEFVRRLAEALTDHGKEAWVDVEGIRDAEVFPAALRAAIERSDGFVFVLSPDSIASAYCEQEVEHALELNKRIVPLLLRPVSDDAVPEGVRVRNWIPFVEPAEFDHGIARVVDALDTDLAWAKEHTRWLLKALEWDAEGRERSFLLRGSELAAAETWLGTAAAKEPQPNALQREYVAASRLAATRRQRWVAGASGAVALVSLALLVFALLSRSQAIGARNTARSQALAADSQTQLAVDPERSILLAEQAVRQEDARGAVRAPRCAGRLTASLPPARRGRAVMRQLHEQRARARLPPGRPPARRGDLRRRDRAGRRGRPRSPADPCRAGDQLDRLQPGRLVARGRDPARRHAG